MTEPHIVSIYEKIFIPDGWPVTESYQIGDRTIIRFDYVGEDDTRNCSYWGEDRNGWKARCSAAYFPDILPEAREAEVDGYIAYLEDWHADKFERYGERDSEKAIAQQARDAELQAAARIKRAANLGWTS